MKMLFTNFVYSVKYFISFFIANVMKINKKNRAIYLIGERENEAKDNGYHLFKYVREKYPKERFYYVISKNSNDLNKIKKYGNILYYKSFKHFIYYILSRKLICAHVGSCTPDTAICWKMENRKLIKKKRLFIQHGITKEFIPTLTYSATGFEKFICGALPEYEFVSEKFGYEKNAVKYLGFCRFDNLHEFKTKNQILIMPTWRKWIPSSTWNNNNKNYDTFKQTDYYLNYYNLINYNKFIDFLERKNMNAIFYLHYEMQGYRELFKSQSNRVIIADDKNYDVQQLLKESKLLITDYSSIAFDFAYMKKPLIYYQFDYKEYSKNHYGIGYFNYERDGFGPVVNDIDSLVNILNDDIYADGKYKSKINKFFELNDNENCERHYREIIK